MKGRSEGTWSSYCVSEESESFSRSSITSEITLLREQCKSELANSYARQSPGCPAKSGTETGPESFLVKVVQTQAISSITLFRDPSGRDTMGE